MRFRHLFQREFWTSFAFNRKRDFYWGDGSQRWSVSLTGFYRNVRFSYSRPWTPPDVRRSRA